VNLLYYGDNLKVLREHVKDETADLIYLRPALQERSGLQRPVRRARHQVPQVAR